MTPSLVLNPIDAAMHSLIQVLSGVPGMFVSANRHALVVTVTDDSSEADRHLLRRITRDGWEKWQVRIEGCI